MTSIGRSPAVQIYSTAFPLLACRLELRTQDLSELTRFPKDATLRVLKVNKRTNLPINPWSR